MPTMFSFFSPAPADLPWGVLPGDALAQPVGAQLAPKLFFRSAANANREPSKAADQRQDAKGRTRFSRPVALAADENAPHMQRRLFAQLELLLMIDELTGLLNHRSFAQTLKLAPPHERSKTGGSLIYLELAGIELAKHQDAADRAMKEVSTLLRQIFRKSGFAARLPGLRFGIILPQTSLDLARHQVARLQLAIEQAKISYNGARLDIDTRLSVQALTHSSIQRQLIAAGETATARRHAPKLTLVR